MQQIMPKEIFDFIKNETENIHQTLLEHNSEDGVLKEEEKREVEFRIKQFRGFQDSLTEKLEELEKDTHWDKFTIAFYGETNAGKSTIIETLRLAMNEASKQGNEARFQQIINELKELKNSVTPKKEELENLLNEINTRIAENTQNYENERKSFFGKLKSFIGLSKFKGQLKSDTANRAQIEEKLLSLQSEYKADKTEKFNLLKTCCDGMTISSQTDFTKEVVRYDCNAKGEIITLLDVPGIEGKEQGLKNEIAKATREAHCVFCVVRYKIEEGTLNTIKDGLNSQTEVYLIFNKSATNPHAIKSISNDEDAQMLAMEEKIRQALGKSYAGKKVIYALPSFLSQAKSLVPDSILDDDEKGYFITSKTQEKFLKKYDGNENEQKERLFSDSGCKDFVKFLEAELVANTAKKIQANVFNKTNMLVGEFALIIQGLADSFHEMYEKVRDNANSLDSSVFHIVSSKKSLLNSEIDNSLSEFESNARQEMYEFIETNVKDDVFKRTLQSTLEERIPALEDALKKNFENIGEKLQNELKEEFEYFARKSEEMVVQIQSNMLANIPLDIKYEIDSGINWLGVGVLLLLAALHYVLRRLVGLA